METLALKFVQSSQRSLLTNWWFCTAGNVFSVAYTDVFGDRLPLTAEQVPSSPALYRGTLNPFLCSETLDRGSGLISSSLSTLLFSGETAEAIQSLSPLSVQGTQGQASLLELSPEPDS